MNHFYSRKPEQESVQDSNSQAWNFISAPALFDSYEIGTFQSYGKADVAQSLVFSGLSVDVKELFGEVTIY